MKNKPFLSNEQIDRIIEMAWEDRTPFDAIFSQFGLNEKNVIDLMRKELKINSFKLWRERVREEKLSTVKLVDNVDRFKCSRQKNISNNKISKR